MHLNHREILFGHPQPLSPVGFFSPCHAIRHSPSLLYTSDTVRLNFTSCHSARMASPPSHMLTRACTNSQTHTQRVVRSDGRTLGQS